MGKMTSGDRVHGVEGGCVTSGGMQGAGSTASPWPPGGIPLDPLHTPLCHLPRLLSAPSDSTLWPRSAKPIDLPPPPCTPASCELARCGLLAALPLAAERSRLASGLLAVLPLAARAHSPRGPCHRQPELARLDGPPPCPRQPRNPVLDSPSLLAAASWPLCPWQPSVLVSPLASWPFCPWQPERTRLEAPAINSLSLLATGLLAALPLAARAHSPRGPCHRQPELARLDGPPPCP
jgi:hypothetical protein